MCLVEIADRREQRVQGKKIRPYTYDADVAAYIDSLPHGNRSRFVNEWMRKNPDFIVWKERSMTPFFAGNSTEICMSKQSDTPSADRLIAVWSTRNSAVEKVQKHRPLTQEDISMDTQLQQYSDQLEYDDKMSDDRNWIHRTCFFVKKSVSNFEQVQEEYWAIVNLYSSISANMQHQYQQKLLDAGYPDHLVHAVPIMSVEQSEDAYIE